MPGGVGSGSGAESALEIYDLADRAAVADKEVDRRFFWAGATTVTAPINFLFESLFWEFGWPSVGPLVFSILVLLAVGAWIWWTEAWVGSRRLRKALGRRSAELELPRRPEEDLPVAERIGPTYGPVHG